MKLKRTHLTLLSALGITVARMDSATAEALGSLHSEGAKYAQVIGQGNYPVEEQRLDAAESIMAARDIENVHRRAYQKRYPDLKAENGDILPIFTDVDEGDENYKFEIWDATGSCQWLDMNSDGLQGADAAVHSLEVEGKIHWYSSYHSWTIQQLRRASRKRTSFNLTTVKLNANKRAAAQKTNQTWLFGDEQRGLIGMTTNPFVQRSFASGTGVSRYFPAKTNAEINTDFSSLIHAIDEQTNGINKATKVAMSRRTWNLLQERSISNFQGGDGTIVFMDFLQKAHPDVEFMIVEEFAASKSFDGSDLVNGSGRQRFEADILVAWDGSMSADELGFVRPRNFTPGTMEQRGLRFEVVSTGVIGGIRMVYPLAIHVMEGVGVS